LYKIEFYKDKSGKQPTQAYIIGLSAKRDKDNRIKFNKISDYINALAEHGQALGMPYMKRIDGEIWELRPLRDRIFFVAWRGDSFLILHHFMKRTQKTPQREIDTAKRRLQETIANTEGDTDEQQK
jgi:phage-related protein